MLSVIRQDVRADYVAVPALLDGRGTDVVLIEHEYGIFGGDAGSYVLSLVQDLRQPFVVTLHTVLSAPSAGQAEVLGELCRRAALVTVFTDTARRMVVMPASRRPLGCASSRTVPRRHCCRRSPTPPTALPAEHDGSHRTMAHLQGRTVLSTFGLISAGQGHRDGHRGARRDRPGAPRGAAIWWPVRPTRRW